MQFNSFEFIILFLPLTFVGYFLLNRSSFTLGKLFLILAGIFFYTYAGFASLPVLLAGLVINYAAACAMVRKERYARLILTADILCNIALLFYFKYFTFTLSLINPFLRSPLETGSILLPLGISFYTFQQIDYAVNVYRKGKNESLTDYLLYILYFPKLIMGPITEPDYLIPQFSDESRKHIKAENIACGIKIFSLGLFKKMILADTFAAAIGWCLSNPGDATAADLILGTLAYTFEIYFDFSAYSDMAVGISMMLNIDLPINFDSPYKALSIRDFWKRWHISLTGFLTRNVYIPLGGSRRGTRRTYINVLLVFLVSGIWHGANFTFLLWGLLHGLLCVFDRLFEKAESRVHPVVRWFAAFLCVNFLWLLFRVDSVSQWIDIINRILHFENMAVSEGLLSCFAIQEMSLLIPLLHLSSINGVEALFFYAAAFLLCLVPENNYRRKDSLSPASAVLAAAALFIGFIHVGGESVFVYFNF